jgi:hypothetical protein
VHFGSGFCMIGMIRHAWQFCVTASTHYQRVEERWLQWSRCFQICYCNPNLMQDRQVPRSERCTSFCRLLSCRLHERVCGGGHRLSFSAGIQQSIIWSAMLRYELQQINCVVC